MPATHHHSIGVARRAAEPRTVEGVPGEAPVHTNMMPATPEMDLAVAAGMMPATAPSMPAAALRLGTRRECKRGDDRDRRHQ